MAREAVFQITVVTPEAPVLDRKADLAVLPAHDGQIGILLNRAPLLCKLGAGVLRIEGPGGVQKLAIDGGFAECVDNKVTVLTDYAWKADDVRPEQVREELQAAKQMPIKDDSSRRARDRALARAKAKAALLAK